MDYSSITTTITTSSRRINSIRYRINKEEMRSRWKSNDIG